MPVIPLDDSCYRDCGRAACSFSRRVPQLVPIRRFAPVWNSLPRCGSTADDDFRLLKAAIVRAPRLPTRGRAESF